LAYLADVEQVAVCAVAAAAAAGVVDAATVTYEASWS